LAGFVNEMRVTPHLAFVWTRGRSLAWDRREVTATIFLLPVSALDL
jgi:hypothetical protein